MLSHGYCAVKLVLDCYYSVTEKWSTSYGVPSQSYRNSFSLYTLLPGALSSHQMPTSWVLPSCPRGSLKLAFLRLSFCRGRRGVRVAQVRFWSEVSEVRKTRSPDKASLSHISLQKCQSFPKQGRLEIIE